MVDGPGLTRTLDADGYRAAHLVLIAKPPTGAVVELRSPALKTQGCAPRLLQRSFSTREDLLHALIDTQEGVMRRVTNRPGMLGAY
jgi:hypothetical protein